MTTKMQFRGSAIEWQGVGIYAYFIGTWVKVTSLEQMENLMRLDYCTAYIQDEDLTES